MKKERKWICSTFTKCNVHIALLIQWEVQDYCEDRSRKNSCRTSILRNPPPIDPSHNFGSVSADFRAFTGSFIFPVSYENAPNEK